MRAPLPQSEPVDGVWEVGVGFGDLAIERGEIAATLGYGDGAMPEHFGDLLDQALAEAARRCLPRAGYRLLAGGRAADRGEAVRVGGTVFTTQRIVAGALARAEHVVLFAATIGTEFEEWARATMTDDPALGFIADAVGSAAAEALADRLHDQIALEMARRGWSVTNRYSPGYCGWSVAEQRALFALLPPGFCGITLGESALMQPIKSVSGLVGVGPDVRFADYQCETCRQPDCTYRRFRLRRSPAPAAARPFPPSAHPEDLAT